MYKILLIILSAFLCLGCKSSSSVSKQSFVREKALVSQGETKTQTNVLGELNKSLNILRNTNARLVIYDSSKPPDSISGIPTILAELFYSNNDKIESVEEGRKEDNSIQEYKNKTELKESDKADLDESAEKNKKTKVEQSTSLLWAIVALLVVGLFIYNRIKK